jgi:hypothetical protein
MIRFSKLAAIVAILSLGGCSLPILGAWKSSDQTSYYNNTYMPNRLTLGDDQTGEAIVVYTLVSDGTIHTDQFEVTWTENTISSYTLKLACVFHDGVQTDCHDENFVMTCAVPTGTVTTFSCKGTGFFSDYPFTWVPLMPPASSS